jgi:CDP-diacylglycerol--glycerol-3-phosphate 3-phosphatidyltransferase
MNLANRISIFRIVLVPIFIAFLLIDIEHGDIIATIVFIIAAFSDFLDGYIARRYNQITDLGKFIDPLADKLLVSAALICLVEMGRISAWIVILIIGREFMVTGVRGIAATNNVVIAASKWGKLKTVTQMITIVFLLLENYPFSLVGFPFTSITIVLTIITTVFSGVDYLWKARNVIS